MKTIQCGHPPHHHNSFVATCRLWTVSGGVHVLLVLEHIVCLYIYMYVSMYVLTK